MTLARERSSWERSTAEVPLVLSSGAFGRLVEEARGAEGAVTVVVLDTERRDAEERAGGLDRLGRVLARREGWSGRVGWLDDGSLSVLLPRLSTDRARRIAAGFERLGTVLIDRPLQCDLRVLPPRKREWSMPLSW